MKSTSNKKGQIATGTIILIIAGIIFLVSFGVLGIQFVEYVKSNILFVLIVALGVIALTKVDLLKRIISLGKK